mmetsp:Transcript_126003/g.368147  ORF Transcript_126003/g.368147 Transcript_126003/m.368147 type:complete len:163 (+) Transcript_126003:406-894(+)
MRLLAVQTQGVSLLQLVQLVLQLQEAPILVEQMTTLLVGLQQQQAALHQELPALQRSRHARAQALPIGAVAGAQPAWKVLELWVAVQCRMPEQIGQEVALQHGAVPWVVQMPQVPEHCHQRLEHLVAKPLHSPGLPLNSRLFPPAQRPSLQRASAPLQSPHQ